MTSDLSSALNCKREARIYISESLLKLLLQPGSSQALNALWEGWQKYKRKQQQQQKLESRLVWFCFVFDLLCHQMQELNMLSICSAPSPGRQHSEVPLTPSTPGLLQCGLVCENYCHAHEVAFYPCTLQASK